MAFRPSERPPHHHGPPPSYPPPFAQQPQTAQPPVQMPFSDPFHISRDPFLPGAHVRRESFGPARGWPPTQAGIIPHQQQHLPPHPSPQQGQPLPPPPPPNGLGQMSMPYDPSRRRSLGGAGSPPQYIRGPLEPPAPPSFPTRNMPPPSPPQMPPPSAASHHLASAPRGPPTTSPFAGARDLASFASHRPGAGMSISSMLGGGEERKPTDSPHVFSVAPLAAQSSMQPPSPGRARSSSMREGLGRREPSPIRGGMFGEPRAQSAFRDRNVSEPRREGMFASPQLQREALQFPRESPHSFRAFKPEHPEQRAPPNGAGPLGRPISQPAELVGPRSVEEIIARREVPGEGRFGTFRHFGEPVAPPQRNDMTPRNDAHPFPNGVTSQPRESEIFGSPQMDRDLHHIPSRFQPGVFGTPMREDQTGLFRPAFPHAPDAARESIEARALHDLRRGEPRSSPPISDLPMYARMRNGFTDRPMTLEEHQRMEAMQREQQQQQQRKESDGSGHRSLLGISPDMSRKGRNSPLPQAVQGAQPRHVGPGGNNPGIKMEFGRMFSGLGSGVGSTTPNAGQSVNGATTPSRLSPARHLEDGDLVQTAVSNIEDWKVNSKAKGAKKSGRRSRDEEKFDGDDRATPDLSRGNKRTKTPTLNVTSRKLLEEAASKPRKHLGSQLYTTELTQSSNADTSLDAKIKFVSKMKPIPYFEGKDNCTYTVRVPRYYFTSSEQSGGVDGPSALEEICKHGQLWGTDAYTDDSNVVAAAVHSGWLKGDFGEHNNDLVDICDNDSDAEDGPEDIAETPTNLTSKPRKPVRPPAEYPDVHITLLVLPPLESYASSTQHHVRSKEWKKAHDGMSFMIHSVEFVDEGAAGRYVERGVAARKQRMAIEEAKRREAAAGLLMFANGIGADDEATKIQQEARSKRDRPGTTQRVPKVDFTGLEHDADFKRLLARYPLLKLQLQRIYGLTLEPGPDETRSWNRQPLYGQQRTDAPNFRGRGRGRGRGFDTGVRGGRGRGGFQANEDRQHGPWTQEKGDKEGLAVIKKMRQGDEEDEKAEGMREFVELCLMKFGPERKVDQTIESYGSS
ncbi:hypothetical protein LTR85_007637 [Meristemomyces frigidus]|nr:hypothetical protein LTR85_007637 [Meristemomyces frigidus]